MSRAPGTTHGGWIPANKSLGRGLDSLLGEGGRSRSGDGTRTLALDQIQPDPDQPRRRFDEDALGELADSIRERGVIQPLIVRPDGNRFRLVAGERRWRASRLAGLSDVPVVVREITEPQVFEIALIENIQRADLNALEEARAYKRLMDDHGHTQARLAQIVGKSRSHIANLTRLLDLPEPVQAMVQDGRLSMGHARALLASDDPLAAAKAAVQESLSVRETEKRARKPRPARRRPEPAAAEPTAEPRTEMEADLKMLVEHLSAALGLEVAIRADGEGVGGRMTIDFASAEELDRLCQLLTGEG